MGPRGEQRELAPDEGILLATEAQAYLDLAIYCASAGAFRCSLPCAWLCTEIIILICPMGSMDAEPRLAALQQLLELPVDLWNDPCADLPLRKGGAQGSKRGQSLIESQLRLFV